MTRQMLTILHCVSAYPAPLDQMNLRVIEHLREFFGRPVGLSDHTTGFDAAVMALALGARTFEKHLTLNRAAPGPDHAASFEPWQMARYVKRLHECAAALGDGVKVVMPCEVENRRRFIDTIDHASISRSLARVRAMEPFVRHAGEAPYAGDPPRE